MITQPGETVEQAVSRADKLMYQAKNRKNMVVTEDNARDGALSAAGRESQTRQSILIVDDSEMNRAILAEILGSDYNILEATNGRECLAMLEQYDTGIALILLDIVMPVMDGFAVLSEMNHSHWIEDIPVIMISSEDADTVVRRAYELGVSDYVSRPFDAGVVYRRVFNTIKLYAKQRRLASLVTSQIKEKEKNTKMMISILSEVVEFRNGESGQHVLHIGTLTQRLLERLTQKTDRYDLPPETQELIVMASALHDIGKVAIDDKILNKPGRLTPEEFDLMKTHTVVGANMLDHLGRYKNESACQDSPRHLPLAPRALGRPRLPRRPGRGRHPDFGADRLDGGRLRRAGQQARLQGRLLTGHRGADDPARRLRAVQPPAAGMSGGNSGRLKGRDRRTGERRFVKFASP